jgi:MFS family permease
MSEAAYKRYLLVVLLVIFAFSSVDRLALGLMLQTIKRDLQLSDTQLGMLTGIAFALFYAVMGVPIARLADRGGRVRIIAVSVALWSVGVALCGMAGSFVQLLLIRIGVAVGEAGCVPPSHSLIAEYFSRAQRPRAIAIYMLGAPLSAFIGLFVAGWLNQFYGWRTTFLLLGLPGVVLACIAALTLKDPRERHDLPPGDVAQAHPSLVDVATVLWRNKTFRHLVCFFSISSFFASGIAKWQPAFFVRSYGLETGELGSWYAALTGIGGFVGMYCGGELATRYAANQEGRQLRAVTAMYGAFAIISPFIYLATSKYLAFALIGLAQLTGALCLGPLFAIVQSLTPERMRATAIAIVYLFSNLIGLGLGPLAAGALSDGFRSWAGDESLRYALLALCPGYAWGAWHVWRASTTVTRDLASPQLG